MVGKVGFSAQSFQPPQAVQAVGPRSPKDSVAFVGYALQARAIRDLDAAARVRGKARFLELTRGDSASAASAGEDFGSATSGTALRSPAGNLRGNPSAAPHGRSGRASEILVAVANQA
jgi:hypothetical protein